ncbi:MAG: metal-sulfur cluster assembly factor [bacterium]
MQETKRQISESGLPIEQGTENIWQALQEVADPEFPVSVVDMGLVYGIKKKGRKVTVDLTFTSMGCPCMEMIIMDIQNRLKKEPNIDAVDVEIVWDPPWTPEKLSSHAVDQLSVWGVSV